MGPQLPQHARASSAKVFGQQQASWASWSRYLWGSVYAAGSQGAGDCAAGTLQALAMLGMSSVLDACSTERLISSLRQASEILLRFVRRQSWTLASPAQTHAGSQTAPQSGHGGHMPPQQRWEDPPPPRSLPKTPPPLQDVIAGL